MSDTDVLRVFLDSNVLFSASYSEDSRFLNFWRMDAVIPVTCPYSMDEVRRRALKSGHAATLEPLIRRMEVVSDGDVRFIPAGTAMVEKDRQILAAAIACGANYLVTGDGNHFGHLYGKVVGHVMILPPSDFLVQFAGRINR